MRFPRDIGIPLPNICYKSLEEFIIDIVDRAECFIKEGTDIKNCNIQSNPCSFSHKGGRKKKYKRVRKKSTKLKRCRGGSKKKKKCKSKSRSRKSRRK